jgi:hypothetical protein
MERPARTSLFEASHLCQLTDLLSHIHTGKTALVDFQRDFVWKPAMTQDLIVSIAHNHAAGDIWRIRHTRREFTWREFQDSPALDGCQPTFLVLDGQQRLTSLYQAFYGVGQHRYYVNLQRLLEGDDFEDCVFYLRAESRQARAYETLAVQARDLVLPLGILHNGLGTFGRWSRQIARTRSTASEREALEEALSEVDEAWIRPMADYEFPVVTLAETTGVAAVCQMFVKLNGTGVKLGPFELLTASCWPHAINLRWLWAKARSDYPIIAEFAVDPYYLLQIIALLASRPPRCTLKYVLTLQASTVAAWWDRVVESLAKALEILRDDCGVIAPKWLPYTPLVMPLAVVLAQLTRPGSPEAGAIRQKLVRWFWCSVFGRTYELGSNGQAAKDAAELLTWCAGGVPPESVRAFQFDPQVLREATPRQSALYCGAMCLILSRGPRDVHSGAKLTGDVITRYRIDDHHVFPRVYLDRLGVAARFRDCVLNRMLIVHSTNQSLQTRTPAEYFGQLRTTFAADKLRELLRSHLLPSEPDSPLWHDDFEGFLARRQALLWQAIERVTGITQATPMTEGMRSPPSIRGHGTTTAAFTREGTTRAAEGRGAPQSLDAYLTRQSEATQRLFRRLDQGIRALAPDIAARTTKGRRCVGGMSYFSPERLFLCADFLRTADGLTLSVFTGGQRWEGLSLSRTTPRGYYVLRSEAALPQALAWAKAAYEARKRGWSLAQEAEQG